MSLPPRDDDCNPPEYSRGIPDTPSKILETCRSLQLAQIARGREDHQPLFMAHGILERLWEGMRIACLAGIPSMPTEADLGGPNLRERWLSARAARGRARGQLRGQLREFTEVFMAAIDRVADCARGGIKGREGVPPLAVDLRLSPDQGRLYDFLRECGVVAFMEVVKKFYPRQADGTKSLEKLLARLKKSMESASDGWSVQRLKGRLYLYGPGGVWTRERGVNRG